MRDYFGNVLDNQFHLNSKYWEYIPIFLWCLLCYVLDSLLFLMSKFMDWCSVISVACTLSSKIKLYGQHHGRKL